MTQWVKHDEWKLPLYTVLFEQFPEALQTVAECSDSWHKKYELNGDWNNFRRVENPKRYLNAMIRHLVQSKWWLERNPDGDVLHMAQVAWNALAYLQILLDESN